MGHRPYGDHVSGELTESRKERPPADSLGDQRQRSLVRAMVGVAVALALLSVVWIVMTARAVERTTEQLSFARAGIADARLYDETLTMSATMAAQTGDPRWTERYARAEQGLADSLLTARREASDTESIAILSASAANDTLLRMEEQALRLSALGDLAGAQSILESADYAKGKQDYAQSIESAERALTLDIEHRLSIWRWLLALQALLTLAAISMIIALARASSRRSSRAEQRLATSMDSAVVGMALVSPNHRITYANEALCRILGCSQDRVIGRTFLDFTDPDDSQALALIWKELDDGRRTSTARQRLRAASGAVVWVDASMATVRDGAGAVSHFIEQFVDVTAEVEAQSALTLAVERFRLLAENATDVVFRTDISGTIQWASAATTAVLGRAPEDLVGTLVMDLVDPRDRAIAMPLREALLERGEPVSLALRFVATDGDSRTMSVFATPVRTAAGAPDGLVIGLRDVTAEEFIRGELEVSERRFRLAMQAAPGGVAITGPDGVFTEANPALCRMLSVDRSEIVGRRLNDFLGASDQESADLALMSLTREPASTFEHEHRLMGSGRTPWVRHSVSIVPAGTGSSTLFIHQFMDESQAHDLQQELAYRATHDVLTGLSNRAELMEVLGRLTDDRRVRGDLVGVLFCDVDRLKPINDNYGHQAGDAVLAAVADRMAHAVRATDVVARIGGDEFVVVLTNVAGAAQVQDLAEKLRAAVGGPVQIDHSTIEVTVSIGATLATPGEAPDDVLGRADQALYSAKGTGRNRAVVQI